MLRLLVLLVLVLAGGAAWLALDPLERLRAAEPRAQAPPSRAPATEREPRRERPRVRCPRDVEGCRAVTGRIVLVESVDPDGDGDLHVVVTGGGVTAPGLTAIDIAPELRPPIDPAIGSRVSAAGPVQEGTYGQSQIHALRVRYG